MNEKAFHKSTFLRPSIFSRIRLVKSKQAESELEDHRTRRAILRNVKGRLFQDARALLRDPRAC
jgi:hypothetical protein